MVTRTWLWTTSLALLLPASIFSTACGDSSPQGGGGAGGGTGGTGLGGEGTGGNVIAGNDTCENAQAVSVGQDEQTFVQGSMEGAKDDYRVFCADSDNSPELKYPDVVFAVTNAETCTAELTLEGQTGFDGVLSLGVSNCGDDDYCSNDTIGGPESLRLNLEAGTHFVVVSDGGDGTGNYTLGVSCATPTCGDSIVNDGEDCDDGNTSAGDGCDAECQFEQPDPDLDTCAGAEASAGVSIGTGQVIHVPSSGEPRTTVGASDSGTGTCQIGQQPETPAPDHVYKVIPSANGTLIATVGWDFNDEPFCDEADPSTDQPGCWDRAVHVREGVCTDNGNPPPSEIGCSDETQAWWLVESVGVQVVAGTEYFVFVDGYNGDEAGAGLYVLRLELQ